MSQRTLAFLIFGLLHGCADDRAEVQYDLTRSPDRALFTAHGLAFAGVTGAYALFRVSDAHPQLVGPRLSGAGGAAGLLAAHAYFTEQKNAKPATLLLRRGAHPLVATTLAPAQDGDCTDGQTPGGDSGGSSCDMGNNEVTVDVNDAPMGAVVLIGRVWLGGQTNTELVPPVCCDANGCVVRVPDSSTGGSYSGQPIK